MKGKRPRYLFSLKSVLVMTVVLALFTGVNFRPTPLHGYSWLVFKPYRDSAKTMDRIVGGPILRGDLGQIQGMEVPAKVSQMGWPLVFRRDLLTSDPFPSDYEAWFVHPYAGEVQDLETAMEPSRDWIRALPSFGSTSFRRLAANFGIAIGISLAASFGLEFIILRRWRAKRSGPR